MKKKLLKYVVIILIIFLVSFVFYYKYSKTSYGETNPQNTSLKREVKLTLVGDLLFEQPFYDAVEKGYQQNSYFSFIKDYFLNDDLSIGNMEVVIGNDSLKPSGTGYNFCAPEYIGDLVNTLDFEVLGTANNHSYDRGIEGVKSTIEYFENNTDIKTVGTYKSKEDRENYRILEINNIKIGILSYTYGTNQKVDKEYQHLIGFYKDPNTRELTEEYKEILKSEINNVRKLSDVVIVLMHWGTEFTFDSDKEQKEVANYLNSLNVDIIVGSHSHSMQPVEIIGDNHKTLVYYSLGNFLSQDDDIARTKKGYETFDNAYQIGLLSTLTITKEDKLEFKDILVKPIINYFDSNMNNFKLIPYDQYNKNYEINHYRYSYGLTKEFIDNTYNSVINIDYH